MENLIERLESFLNDTTMVLCTEWENGKLIEGYSLPLCDMIALILDSDIKDGITVEEYETHSIIETRYNSIVRQWIIYLL